MPGFIVNYLMAQAQKRKAQQASLDATNPTVAPPQQWQYGYGDVGGGAADTLVNIPHDMTIDERRRRLAQSRTRTYGQNSAAYDLMGGGGMA